MEDVFNDEKVRGKLVQQEMKHNVKLFHLQLEHRPHAYMNDPQFKDTCRCGGGLDRDVGT